MHLTDDVYSWHSGDLDVYGQLWADNSEIDCVDDTTQCNGILFEGEGASLSRITDSIIRGGIDGITINNASPDVKEYQHVKIAVYDILGKQVRVLTNSKQDVGGHKVIWDGRNQYGNAVASGLYFIRIQTPENTKLFKVSYLK